jgi:nitrogen-specific signal transduction histidine kinase
MLGHELRNPLAPMLTALQLTRVRGNQSRETEILERRRSTMLEAVFEPFVQQAKAADRGPGGLGLGLAIVRNLVAAHGGRVRAESAGRDRGSEFIVELPAADAPATPAARSR